ncbi:MAG: cytidylate kinase-like family protein [Deltaproteobacteria bacterium]|nr:cytidylate kinase-like family protein [Deltaproteobacteria bacterium]
MEMSEPLKEEIIRKQIERWEKRGEEKKNDWVHKLSTITVSVEAGSGGTLIAREVAERLDFDHFDKAIVEIIADSAEISEDVVRAMERQRRSGIEDFIASCIEREYIYPGTYLKHLVHIVTAIGLHGHAVIVGRGANFILPSEERFAVRIIAREELRIQNISERFGISREDARARVLNRDSKRTAFVKKSFRRDIADPIHYDVVVNSEGMKVEETAAGIAGHVLALREAMMREKSEAAGRGRDNPMEEINSNHPPPSSPRES